MPKTDPCGSGKGFKRCCMGREIGDESLPPGARVVERHREMIPDRHEHQRPQ
jgi:uncharacterized protein YchJ